MRSLEHSDTGARAAVPHARRCIAPAGHKQLTIGRTHIELHTEAAFSEAALQLSHKTKRIVTSPRWPKNVLQRGPNLRPTACTACSAQVTTRRPGIVSPKYSPRVHATVAAPLNHPLRRYCRCCPDHTGEETRTRRNAQDPRIYDKLFLSFVYAFPNSRPSRGAHETLSFSIPEWDTRK